MILNRSATNRAIGLCVSLLSIVCLLQGQDSGIWKEVAVPKPLTSPYYLVDFADPSHGWLLSKSGEYVKTSDGGKTWLKMEVNFTNSIATAKWQDSLSAMIVTINREDARLFVTTNAGDNWTESFLPDTVFFPTDGKKISLLNKNIIGFINRSMFLYTSTNGGIDWSKTHIESNRFQALVHLDILAPNNAFMGGGYGFLDKSGFLVQSSDGGNTWKFIVDSTSITYSSSHFFSDSLGYFWLTFGDDPSFSYTRFYNSSDGGKSSILDNWITGALYRDGSALILPSCQRLTQIEQAQDSVFILGDPKCTGVNIIGFSSLTRKSAWILGDSSRLFQRIDVLDAVRERSNGIRNRPGANSSVEIIAYPNPFNGSSKVDVISTRRLYGVKVYVSDVLGRIVALLYDGNLEQGHNDFSWRGREQKGYNVASGVYYLSVISEVNTTTIPLLFLK